MKKVICLYRVSTKSQVDYVGSEGKNEEDIPVQRIACHQFCDEKNWVIIKEFQEAAVSAYFTPTFGRDAIRSILVAAQNHEFDILLVFTLDRLSRRDYEFPMLIEQMTENGISVWSVKDGECSYRTSTERLLVYLAGWRASCESERLGERVKAAQSQMVARGEYRGGAVPFGYRLVKTNQLNRSGHHKQELCIHEEEAAVIRMIFNKIVYEGFTVYALAQFLQTYVATERVRKQDWRKTTIQSMIKNPIYIGCLRFNNELSPPFKHLQILDPDLFHSAQAIVHSRASKKRTAVEYPPVEAAPVYHNLLYCGHCGAPLVFTHAFQKNRNGTITIRYYYRCYGKEKFADICNGPCTYSSVLLDNKILAHMDTVISIILQGDSSAMIANAIELERAKRLAGKEELIGRYQKILDQVEVTQDSVVTSLRQYGVAGTTNLEILYRDLCSKRDALTAELAEMEKNPFNPIKTAAVKSNELQQLKTICSHFMDAKEPETKQLLPKLVNRIRVYKDYQLEFEYTSVFREFLSITDDTIEQVSSTRQLPASQYC